MFELKLCACEGCKKAAVSRVKNGILETGEFCADHLPDKAAVCEELCDFLRKNEKIVGLRMADFSISNIDISGKKFAGCDFRRCAFFQVNAAECVIRVSNFDFSIFSDCCMAKSNFLYVSLAGASFSHIIWTDAELVHNNFNGILARQCSFDHSDLYNSHFVRSDINDASFRHCNLQNSIFYDATLKNVSFNFSNTNDANFRKENRDERVSLFVD